MNDERVDSGWGEKGNWEKHVEYVKGVVDDPHVLPLIMSWDGARMGYVELVWIKMEITMSRHYHRELHVLVDEDRFRGRRTFRSITHYTFLAEARTAREPKRANAALVRTSVDGSMHLETRSVMTIDERLFKKGMFIEQIAD
ncbi:hypothetical protein DFH11DRAFT_1546642 [Phellopilus nigrolimitatus]|nr:hypothetical protein DFH11DRAFT_1546642 [Phellopilus nigrolimitatus]